MALQPCEEVNNIHEGKLYQKTFRVNNNSSSSMTWQGYLANLAAQINTFLNALPDNYMLIPVTLFGTATTNVGIIDTNGTSHNYSAGWTNITLDGGDGNIRETVYRLQKETASCHYTVGTSNRSNNTWSIVSNDTTEAVAANSYKDARLDYMLVLVDTTTPTE